jgi:hypothetical protein
MNWRPHTQAPEGNEVSTALIAVSGDGHEDGEPYLLGIFMWKNGQWIDEIDDTEIPAGTEFHWLPEDELLQTLKGEAS